jgi:hypothetical protein
MLYGLVSFSVFWQIKEPRKDRSSGRDVSGCWEKHHFLFPSVDVVNDFVFLSHFSLYACVYRPYCVTIIIIIITVEDDDNNM